MKKPLRRRRMKGGKAATIVFVSCARRNILPWQLKVGK